MENNDLIKNFAEVASVGKDIKQLKQDISDGKIAKANLEKDVNLLKIEISELKLELDSKKQEYKNILDELKNKVEEAKSERSAILGSLNSERLSFNTMGDKLQSLKAELFIKEDRISKREELLAKTQGSIELQKEVIQQIKELADKL